MRNLVGLRDTLASVLPDNDKVCRAARAFLRTAASDSKRTEVGALFEKMLVGELSFDEYKKLAFRLRLSEVIVNSKQHYAQYKNFLIMAVKNHNPFA